MINCPKCGELLEERKNFCPNCGKSIMQQGKKTGKPIAGGILIIIAAVFCFLASIFCFIGDRFTNGVVVIPFGFEIWGFSIGIIAGICALKRIQFAIAIIGCSFVIVGGAISVVLIFLNPFIFVSGIIILILGILGTVFIAVSKNEFQRK